MGGSGHIIWDCVEAAVIIGRTLAVGIHSIQLVGGGVLCVLLS